jgi:hypothetical protein
VGFGFLGGPRWREAARVLQSSSSRRFVASAVGFLTFTQQSARLERYGEPRRFETMPSQPSAQAFAAQGHACHKFDISLDDLILGQRGRRREAKRGSRFEKNVPPPTRHRRVRDYSERTRVNPRRNRYNRAPGLG